MAEWIPPKTNWENGQEIDYEDVNRMEGNSLYLYEEKPSLIQAESKADALTLSANDPNNLYWWSRI